MNTKRKFGWIPDLEDVRDFLGLPPVLLGILKGKELPEKVDLRQFCSKVHDQGELGSCTAQAIVSVMEFLDNISDGKYVDLSRLMLYWFEREEIDCINEDSGAYIRDGIKLTKSVGICSESEWPYDEIKFKEYTLVPCNDFALYKSLSYHRINSLKEVKQALSLNHPVVFGIELYDSFMSPEVARMGLVTMPKKGEKYTGGHAVYCVGYDDANKELICMNSWGEAWGNKGAFYLPYDYFEEYSSDRWVITKLNYDV